MFFATLTELENFTSLFRSFSRRNSSWEIVCKQFRPNPATGDRPNALIDSYDYLAYLDICN